MAEFLGFVGGIVGLMSTKVLNRHDRWNRSWLFVYAESNNIDDEIP